MQTIDLLELYNSEWKYKPTCLEIFMDKMKWEDIQWIKLKCEKFMDPNWQVYVKVNWKSYDIWYNWWLWLLEILKTNFSNKCQLSA